MREKEIELFEKLLCTIAENHKAFKEDELTAFAGSQGIKYNGNLMIVGRAVNGWTNKWMPSQADNPLKRQSIVQDVFKLNESKCPMIWVSELWGNCNPDIADKYNTKRSSFWRIVRMVTGEFGVADINNADWPSYIAWTNLYKIAPSETGNPSEKLKKIQHDIARQIFIEELCQWKPKRIIFFTGRDWVEPFVKPLVSISEVKSVGLAQWVGKIHIQNDGVHSQFVVLPHPQGKPGQLILSSIIDSFKRLQEETDELRIHDD
ncbi:MAG: hypothetical protein PHZ11_09625 [Desulfitobacteriaceae bacterium]|nr:hypothetical protein [Desulfitobacteriaceae bacterium]MDD4402555.1 hypothetical protein [Desulfitobacteriaceae bacterium]